MNYTLLSHIDEDLDSSEVSALCFLCLDVLGRKHLQNVKDGRGLFLKLQERGLLGNYAFLSQLFNTIGRADLAQRLETEDAGQPWQISSIQTDASPVLSDYRIMLYKIHEDVTQENLTKMKFVLSSKLGRGRLDRCNTALDVLAEMERLGYLSNQKLEDLSVVIEQCDAQLAQEIQRYREGGHLVPHQDSVQAVTERSFESGASLNSPMDPREAVKPHPLKHSLSISETQPSREHTPSLRSDGFQEVPPSDTLDVYAMIHKPRGLCIIINNKHFSQCDLKDRPGTEVDERALRQTFSRLDFEIRVHSDLTSDKILENVEELGSRCYENEDALVVCVLSHGQSGCVFGTDGDKVLIRDLTRPFTSGRCPSLAGKPKLFFIQACQGEDYQKGERVPVVPKQLPGQMFRQVGTLEADAGPVKSVPWDADFLVGMATVEECKSFRHTSDGSIYIQELCKQLERAGKSKEDILTVLTHVNRAVSSGDYRGHKQMPEPKYTLTKKLILSFP